MRDPHVESLHYKISSGEGISYDNPPPISFSNDLGTFNLRDDRLSITPTDHFADEDNARQAIEPFLRSWEIEADLKSNIGMIRFTFERVEVVDRDPPPPDSPKTLKVNTGSYITVGEKVSLHLTCPNYPQPPTTFRTTPDVEVGHFRWTNFRKDKEPLQSMAYFVLTLLESMAGGRPRAAQTFQIDLPVLSKIGELSSTKGDVSTARKAEPGAKYQELSGSEKQWLEDVVRLVILRLGDQASGSPLTPITLSDLPPL